MIWTPDQVLVREDSVQDLVALASIQQQMPDFVEDFHHQASQELALQALSSPSIADAGVAHISQHLHDVCSAASDTALLATPQRGTVPSVSASGLEITTIKADVSFSTYAFISRVFLVPLQLKNIAQFLEHLA